MRVPGRRTVDKQLTCPACGDVIAAVAYRPWPGNLTLTSPDGYRIQPVGGALLLRQAEEQAAADRIAFVRRNLGELLYDLRCRRGHSTLSTAPRLVQAVRATPGAWVRVP